MPTNGKIWRKHLPWKVVPFLRKPCRSTSESHRKEEKCKSRRTSDFFPESKFYESSARVARQKSKINFYAFFPLLVPRPITTSRGGKRKQKSICNIKHKRLRFDGIAALFMHRAWPFFRMHLKWFFWHSVPSSSDLSNRDIVEGTLS